MVSFNSVTYWHCIAMQCYLKTCIFASVQGLCSPYPFADLCTPLHGQVQIIFLQILTEANPELKILRLGLILGDCQLGWYMKLYSRYKIWYLFTLFEFRSAKSVLACDCKTWGLHAGILYISLSLPSCENFEKGLEREQDEYVFLLCIIVISWCLSLNYFLI